MDKLGVIETSTKLHCVRPLYRVRIIDSGYPVLEQTRKDLQVQLQAEQTKCSQLFPLRLSLRTLHRPHGLLWTLSQALYLSFTVGPKT